MKRNRHSLEEAGLICAIRSGGWDKASPLAQYKYKEEGKKETMFGIQFSIKADDSKDAEERATASEPSKKADPTDSVFKIDEDEPEEHKSPRMPFAAKMSKNLGRLTATVGNNFYFPAGTINTMETKTHHLHRPIDRYMADKTGRGEGLANFQDEVEDEQTLENAVYVKEREIRRLKEMVKAEQRKIKICYECRRKFPGAEQLKRHEELSEMHRQNVERNKQLKEPGLATADPGSNVSKLVDGGTVPTVPAADTGEASMEGETYIERGTHGGRTDRGEDYQLN